MGNHAPRWAARSPILLVFVTAVTTGCPSKPTLTGLDPSSGPVGTVVEVQGTDLDLAQVRWDAGSGSETILPTPLYANFFTVPLDASLGNHAVRLYGDGHYSDNTLNFTVIGGVVRPPPRLDDVTVVLFDIDGGGQASMFLLAHGANIDVGAKIVVDGVEQPANFFRLLRNPNMHATKPATLGYPIFHYATVWTYLHGLTPGATLKISIRNLPDPSSSPVESNTVEYVVATSLATLDSDGDGLPDQWEEQGYDADADGTIDIDLPGLGANPLQKDLFVEVDWMAAAEPNHSIWAGIEDAFANAPILNSNGTQGITIHIDRGQVGGGGGGGTIIPYADRIRFDDLYLTGYTYVNFHTVKANPANFAPARLNVYRYAIFAWDNGHAPTASGFAEDFWANDFFVSLGAWSDGTRADFQTGTFIHELGHTLHLYHGGFPQSTNSKDNYNSPMHDGNFWITGAGPRFKYSPSQFSGIDVDCALDDADNVFTYSQGMRPALDENDLNELDGLCDSIPVDWNQDTLLGIKVKAQVDQGAAYEVIQDWAGWANIELDFRAPASGWSGN